jgi:hypothetical protein
VQIIQIRGNRNIQKSEPCPTKIVNQIDSRHVSCLNRAGGLPVRVVRRAVLLPLPPISRDDGSVSSSLS